MFNAFDLMAVLTLDSSQYDKGLDDAGESAKGIGSKIGGALKTGRLRQAVRRSQG